MFYKDGGSREPAPFWNLQMFMWSAPSFVYLNFIFASFCGLVWYQTSGIYIWLNISAFVGIKIFELTLFCFLLTILLMKADNILCIFPKMTVWLLEWVLCFFMVIWNYKIFFKTLYWVKEIVIKQRLGHFWFILNLILLWCLEISSGDFPGLL